jgi:hypothetical protein
MKIVYMCFVSNGFDDHFMTLVSSGMSPREFIPSVVKEYWKSSSLLKDAAGPYIVALNLETLQARPLGPFKLDRDGKLYAQISRGQYSGKPETPEELQERAEQILNS